VIIHTGKPAYLPGAFPQYRYICNESNLKKARWDGMKKHRLIVLFLLVIALLIMSCGKEGQKAEPEKAPKAQQVTSAEEIPFKSFIEGAGFEVTLFEEFPSEEQGIKGRIMAYRSKAANSGGVIYFKKADDIVSPCWHWFFKDAVPDSVRRAEINEDGLWDIRVVTKNGRRFDFIQGVDFTLLAKPREDWLALNGSCSPPTRPDDYALWKCFDGDSATAYRTSIEGDKGAFIDVSAPFGVREGILTIETTEREQPSNCELYADGKKIESFKLEKKQGKQMVRIPPEVQGAKEVRVVFNKSYDGAGIVKIAEFTLK
jgi:hypothetical protein